MKFQCDSMCGDFYSLHLIPDTKADTHTYYRTMASLPGTYRLLSHCPGHDYVGTMVAEVPTVSGAL